MRKTLLTLAILSLAAVPAFAGSAVGDAAPGFKLTALDGKTYDLAELKGKTVVLEWANPNCPVSSRHTREKTMIELAKQHGEVVWLGINSTNPKSGDSMKPAEELAWNQKNGIAYPVLSDPTGATGHAYGARTTPHMFIVDKDGKIAYNGAIDDDPPGRKARAERVSYVGHGLDAEKAGKSPDPAATRPYGCSVKY
ncbi:MAG TPA: redoxin family protein [Thermoanaerobaculia bacterium]|nr:redoxin family protein [Thermoanaerobaculia bacterium]